ncbi:TIGR01906 family membrane protein [Arthrobacter bambusae]|uniref:Integral membrane protein (TIGR01906 family) n=1 Tax=Arthrobacter bambusae TaxID=1338426 RepID=A0AAW8DJW6_9MICC|nr:TIGR01906 family membrane protein [Arthrobacter bambusae]MDP9905223.1 integral membrane protein (TIGR01906 family) [Arthrobacter bambusae]MDQ0129299.1 integral membrane protein (TIGR01906 family) [Arthrobacter bambusae]MDQ0180355.1 integral membrane protein (TIGR01906 family) [Arthrobacter bambusae]
MTEKSPIPKDPDADIHDDGDEPAFEWMKPAAKSAATDARPAGAPDGARDSSSTREPEEGRPGDGAVGAATAGEAARPPAGLPPAGRPVAGPSVAGQQAESRADRKAAEAAEAGQEPALFAEPLPTSALQVRPPEAEVERRNHEREQAANAKPLAPRIFQVLLAVFYPVVLLVLAIRAVASPLFLWVEYYRPGFPGDGYGFNADDRMTYGSYALDYLSNWSGPRYLGELVNQNGEKLFKEGEVSHMADVKTVMLSAFGAGGLMIIIGIIAMLYLRKRSTGGIRRGMFAGSIVTLVLILGLGTLAALGWQQFFTDFHHIFFANGTWTFALDDTLIRLFPGQYWMDSGIAIGALVFITALLTLIFTWPTRRRRGLAPKNQAAAEHSADADPEVRAEAGTPEK